MKAKIKYLRKYKVWKVIHPLGKPPNYLFTFRAACNMARIWTTQERLRRITECMDHLEFCKTQYRKGNWGVDLGEADTLGELHRLLWEV